MELCEDVISGLHITGDASLVTTESYKSFLDQVVSCSKPGLKDGDSICHKQAVYSLTSLFAICCKQDSSLDEIRAVLEDCGFDEERIALFMDYYNANRLDYRNVLSRISSIDKAQIVDVDWRLDYNIKSSQSEKIDQLQYIIRIQVMEPAGKGLRHVDMICSLEQLQDLVGKLKDAIRCAQKHESS